MVSIVRDISNFAGSVGEIRPWAFRIARNRVIDASRRQKIRPIESPLDRNNEPITVDDEPLGEVDLGRLNEAFSQLTAEQREVLWLRYALDLSLEETATIVQSTPDAVAAMAYRALSRLRKSAR